MVGPTDTIGSRHMHWSTLRGHGGIGPGWGDRAWDLLGPNDFLACHSPTNREAPPYKLISQEEIICSKHKSQRPGAIIDGLLP